MAKLIVKWRYIKPGTPKHGQHLVKYIATREGVEKCDESWKQKTPTREQTRLIKELLEEYPSLCESHEYEDHQRMPTQYTASQLIAKGIDENIDLIGKKENYIGYIAMRPRVEKQGTHGLFTGDDAPIDLDAVAKIVAEHKGLVWTTVLSLRREDADRLGYNNAAAWRDMLRGQSETLAKAMGIPLVDMRWYAAFHNEGEHPHVHLVSYSVGKEPYMFEQGLHRMKSAYAREIFKQDLVRIYAEQTMHRDELRELGTERIKDILSHAYENEAVEAMLLRLRAELQNYKGKMQYGYLPKSAKHLVDGIVDELAKDSGIAELYDLWYEQRENVLKTYTDTMPDRLPLSKNNEFKTIRNAVLQELSNLAPGVDSVEELPTDSEPDKEPTDEEVEADEPQTPKNKWELYRAAKEHLDHDSEVYDPKRAAELYMESAKLGCGIAKYQLGKLFLRGEHLPKNIDYALRWLEESAEEKNPYAEYLLGKLFLNGEDAEQDTERAEKLLKRSADQGNKYSAYTLGKALLDGNILEKNTADGMRLLTFSADHGFAQAEYLLGKLLYRGENCEQNIPKALSYLEKAAYRQNIYAAYLVGKILLTEETVKDAEKAARYFQMAAEQGNEYAEYQLGKMYLFGNGVPRDEEKAMEYLKASAEKGNAYAANLCQCIASHRNVSASLGILRLFQYLTRLIHNRIEDERNSKHALTERKLQRLINEKKQAQGLKIE